MVVLSPPGVVVLRMLDDLALTDLVAPLATLGLVVFAATLIRGLLLSIPRSALRAGVGVAAAGVGLGLALVLTTRVDLGTIACPAKAGPTLGVTVAVALVDAWRQGDPGDRYWRKGSADPAWQENVRALALPEYRRLGSGCWNRLAPIRPDRTWHEFRVTIESEQGPALSTTLSVRTQHDGTEWKVTGVHGPIR